MQAAFLLRLGGACSILPGQGLRHGLGRETDDSMNTTLCVRCTTLIPEGLDGCPACGTAKAPLGTEIRPASLLLLGLTALGGCQGKSVSLYGTEITDTGFFDDDGDGYSEDEGDCDDNNNAIHPGAEETPGDGVDSNCDGEDDT